MPGHVNRFNKVKLGLTCSPCLHSGPSIVFPDSRVENHRVVVRSNPMSGNVKTRKTSILHDPPFPPTLQYVKSLSLSFHSPSPSIKYPQYSTLWHPFQIPLLILLLHSFFILLVDLRRGAQEAWIFREVAIENRFIFLLL